MDSSPFDPNPRPARPGEVPTLESPLAHTAGKSRATVRVRATQVRCLFFLFLSLEGWMAEREGREMGLIGGELGSEVGSAAFV